MLAARGALEVGAEPLWATTIVVATSSAARSTWRRRPGSIATTSSDGGDASIIADRAQWYWSRIVDSVSRSSVSLIAIA